MYIREVKLIDVLYFVLFYILLVVEKDFQYCIDLKGFMRVLNKYDEIFYIIFVDVYGEQNLVLRMVFIGYLIYFVEKLGFFILRYINIFFKVIEEYLESYDGKRYFVKLQILRLMKLVIIVIWLRMFRYVDFILKVLVRLLIDILFKEMYDFEFVYILEELSIQCLIFIKYVNLEYVEKSLQNIIKFDILQSCRCILFDVL